MDIFHQLNAHGEGIRKRLLGDTPMASPNNVLASNNKASYKGPANGPTSLAT